MPPSQYRPLPWYAPSPSYAPPPSAPAAPVAVEKKPAQTPEVTVPILSPEQVERKRAVLMERCAQALATAARLGHQVNKYIVMDVRSQQPLRTACAACGFEVIIEQRTHPMDKPAIHGPATVLDCKPPKK